MAKQAKGTIGRPTVTQEYEQVAVNRLKLHPRNARQGDVGAIKQSIDANGWYGACVVQRSTSTVLAGNHRLQAAMAAGMHSVPVLWVDCDDETALRILIADNRSNDLATNDNNALAALLTELEQTDTGLEGTLYDLEALAQLLNDNDAPLDLSDAGDGMIECPDCHARFLPPKKPRRPRSPK